MLEDIEGVKSLPRSCQEGIDSTQMEYLKELNFSDEDWGDLMNTQQLVTLSALDGRMDELGIAIEDRSELAHKIYSDEMADAYDEFIVETYECNVNEKPRIEAPNDQIQIEQISEVLRECEEIKYENWSTLEISEKESLLNSLEERIAEIENRPPCSITLVPLGENLWGGYDPVTKSIELNSDYVALSDFDTYKEVLDTVIHEGRHAYQDYNVNICEVHPRHSEVESWAENMNGGKWGYWGDCSSLLGQRLYEQQSIEIDARNFASDVLDKLNLNA